MGRGCKFKVYAGVYMLHFSPCKMKKEKIYGILMIDSKVAFGLDARMLSPKLSSLMFNPKNKCPTMYNGPCS